MISNTIFFHKNFHYSFVNKLLKKQIINKKHWLITECVEYNKYFFIDKKFHYMELYQKQ